MTDERRWIVVDEQTKLIVGGPYLWDGKAQWTPPEQGALMLEAEAMILGYAWPPFPDPQPGE